MKTRMDLAVLTCPLIAFCLYYNTLDAGFLYDDRRAILANPDVLAAGSTSTRLWLDDFWGTPLNSSDSHGSYRPLVTLSFRWTAKLAGLDQAYWYHLTNVLLHSLVTAQVTFLAGRVALRQDMVQINRYVSGLLFAVHPIHCEAVAGLVGRADLACTFFFLAGLFIYAKFQLIMATILLMLAAFLTKEYGIMLAPVCVLYDLVVRRDNKTKNQIHWTVLAISSGFFVCFRLWLADFQIPQFSKSDNPVAASSSWTTRTLTFIYLPIFHFGLLVWPRWLSFDWSMDAITPITGLEDVRNLTSVIFYTILMISTRWTVIKGRYDPRWRRIGLTLILTTLPFLPATNLLTHVGFVVAERILYLPSVGYCLLVGIGVQTLVIKTRYRSSSILMPLLAIVLASLSWRTVERNGDWINEERLYRSAIPINPAKAYGNLGVVLQESARLTEAEWSFKRALSYRPNTADVHHNLGNLFHQQQRYKESLHAYNRAIQYRPHLAEAYSQKAKVLVKLQRWAEAEQTLLDCTQLTAASLKDPAAHQSAKISAIILMGDLLARNASRVKEAEDWLLRARQLAPKNPLVYYQLGEFFSARSRHNEAAEVLIQAVQIDPDGLAWTVAAAHALHDASRNSEAEVYFRRAVSLGPTDISHRVNLGAVLHVQGKFNEAEQVYRKALELAPNHPLTMANLRRLHNSRPGSHHNNNQSLT